MSPVVGPPPESELSTVPVVPATVLAAEVLVVSQKCVPVDVFQACVRADQIIIDVNGWAPLKSLPCRYEGLCW